MSNNWYDFDFELEEDFNMVKYLKSKEKHNLDPKCDCGAKKTYNTNAIAYHAFWCSYREFMLNKKKD